HNTHTHTHTLTHNHTHTQHTLTDTHTQTYSLSLSHTHHKMAQDKMAKILTQKYLLQSFFHIGLDTVRSQNDRFQDTVKRSNLFCSEQSSPATSVDQCVPQQGLGRRQGRGHSRNRGAPVWHSCKML